MLTTVLMSAALIVNPGFEDGSKGWTLGKKNYEVVAGVGLKGGKGLVWKNGDPKSFSFAAQKIPLEPGRAYRFTCRVKPKDIVNARVRRRSPAYLAIEVRDNKGVFLYSTGAQPVVDNQLQEEGWVLLAGTTPVLPANLGEAKILCYPLPGSTGTAVYDALEIVPLKAEPIPSVASSVYRDVAVSGAVSFVARCVLNPHRDPRGSVAASFRFVGMNGPFTLPAKISSEGLARVSVDVETLARGTHPVEVALTRRDGSVLATRALDFTRADRPPVRKVALDEYGRTLVDGKPFFPLGLYSARNEVKELDTYCEGPFNCILPYGLPPDAKALDPYHAKGLKVIVSVVDYAGQRGSKVKDPSEEGPFAKRYLDAMKDHPALFAWYLADELPPVKAPNLRARNLLVRAEDPHHPTFVVFDQPDSPADFVEGYDIVGMDPYPIGNDGRRERIRTASTFPDAARKGMYGFRGLWQVPQAFDWSWHRPWAAQEYGARMPNLAELRNMNWQAIASGANGLVGWWFPGMIRNLRNAGKTNEFNEAWGNVKRAYTEVAEKVPLILSVEPAPSVKHLPVGMSARTWRKDGALWLLVVNRTYDPVSGTVNLSDGRAVDVTLEGLGYRFLKLSDPKERRPWSHLDFKNDKDGFRFAVVPDRSGGDYRGAFTNALACCNLMHPDFVMSVGDIIQGSGSERSIRGMQTELTNFVSRLEAPFFYVVGNHDICVDVNTNTPGKRTTHTMTKQVWKEHFGERTYYSFTYKNCLFLALDTMDARDCWTNIRKDLSPEQYDWIRRTLKENEDVRWTFIFMHHPTVWGKPEWGRLEKEALLPRKYTVFAGDWHVYAHYRRYDRDYYVLSVAGGVGSVGYRKYRHGDKRREQLAGPEYGEFDHITWVTMTENGPKVVNIKLDGLLPGDYLSPVNGGHIRHIRNHRYDIPPRVKK